MQRVVSPDGTPIACHRSGTGSPLVLVHGTGAASPQAWAAFPALREHFSVCAVDRRGRGQSGDGAGCAIEREFEDIAAVVAAIGEPADVLGHSFGGLCALEAALLNPRIRRLVLYEPAGMSLPGQAVYPEGFASRIGALLDAGKREEALTVFYGEAAGMTRQEIEDLKSSPAWPQRLAAAFTVPREIRAEQQYRFDPRRFEALRTPTLLLTGGDSLPSLKAGIEALAAALPDSRLALMPGQQHVTMYTAPDLFVQEVLGFLSAPR